MLPDKSSLSCEVLDEEFKPLCILPYEAIIGQSLRHRCVALLAISGVKIALGGKPLLDLPFFAPVAAGQSLEDTARELAKTNFLDISGMRHIRTVALPAGALIAIFHIPASAARYPNSWEWLNVEDLPFLAARLMLGPIVSQLLTDNISFPKNLSR